MMNIFSESFEDARFSGAMAVKQDGKWGFLFNNGWRRIPPTFDSVGWFCEGIISVELNGKMGYVKDDGTYLIEPCFDVIDDEFEDKEDAIDFLLQIHQDNLFHQGIALVRLNGKYGYLKSDGTYLVEPMFDEAYSFNEVHREDHIVMWPVPVELNGSWGYLCRDGKYLIAPIFDKASYFHWSGLALVVLDGKKGLINADGSYYIEPLYEDMRDTCIGIAAKFNGKWGILDEDGSFRIEPQFDDICWFDPSDDDFDIDSDGPCERVLLNGKKMFADIWGNIYESQPHGRQFWKIREQMQKAKFTYERKRYLFF